MISLPFLITLTAITSVFIGFESLNNFFPNWKQRIFNIKSVNDIHTEQTDYRDSFSKLQERIKILSATNRTLLEEVRKWETKLETFSTQSIEEKRIEKMLSDFHDQLDLKVVKALQMKQITQTKISQIKQDESEEVGTNIQMKMQESNVGLQSVNSEPENDAKQVKQKQNQQI